MLNDHENHRTQNLVIDVSWIAVPEHARCLPRASDPIGPAADAVLFVTPEYNRSIPGGLKNAIGWASRPYDKNSFARKPSATIGASPGAIGTAVAQQHLRSLLGYCNSPQMNAPEGYIQFSRDSSLRTAPSRLNPQKPSCVGTWPSSMRSS
jgi:hypothetical protein